MACSRRYEEDVTATVTLLPETWRDLAGYIGADQRDAFTHSNVLKAAELLESHDVIDECGSCGVDLVNVAAFALAAVAHYALAGGEAAEATAALEGLVRASGVETGFGPDRRCAQHVSDGGIRSRG